MNWFKKQKLWVKILIIFFVVGAILSGFQDNDNNKTDVSKNDTNKKEKEIDVGYEKPDTTFNNRITRGNLENQTWISLSNKYKINFIDTVNAEVSITDGNNIYTRTYKYSNFDNINGEKVGTKFRFPALLENVIQLTDGGSRNRIFEDCYVIANRYFGDEKSFDSYLYSGMETTYNSYYSGNDINHFNLDKIDQIERNPFEFIDSKDDNSISKNIFKNWDINVNVDNVYGAKIKGNIDISNDYYCNYDLKLKYNDMTDSKSGKSLIKIYKGKIFLEDNSLRITLENNKLIGYFGEIRFEID